MRLRNLPASTVCTSVPAVCTPRAAIIVALLMALLGAAVALADAPAAPTTTAGAYVNAAEASVGVSITVYLDTDAAADDYMELLLDGTAFPDPLLHVLTAAEADPLVRYYTVTVEDGQWGDDGVKALTAQRIGSAGFVDLASLPLNLTVDTAAPLADVTYLPDRAVKDSDSLVITVTFREDVMVSPVPKIGITYTGGIASLGSTDMTRSTARIYTYTLNVPAGNGTGTVTLYLGTDAAGNVVTATPASGATFVVDNTRPTATLSYDIAHAVKNADTLRISATFSETMTAAPPPQLRISYTGGIAALDLTAMTATANPKVFTYDLNVPAGNGAGSVSLYVATDLAGNVAQPLPSNNTFTVDNTAPGATLTYAVVNGAAITDHANVHVKSGDTLVLTATFTEALGNSATPKIAIDYAGATPDLSATLMTKVSSTVFSYALSVPAGDDTGTVAITLASDPAGNVMASGAPVNKDFEVDNTLATAPDMPTSSAGDTISDSEDAAGFSMTVTGFVAAGAVAGDAMELLLDGSAFPNALSRTLTAGDISADSYAFTITSGQLGADGNKDITALIVDLAGNAGPESVAKTLTLKTTCPTVSIGYSPGNWVKDADTLTITADFSEAMAVAPVPQISVTYSGGILALPAQNMTATADPAVYTYALNVPAGNGIAYVTVGAGTDTYGNAVVTTPTSGGLFTVDNSRPSAAISYNLNRSVRDADTLTITATFSEAMLDAPAPRLSISYTGGIAPLGATAMTKTSATVYSYALDVPAGNGLGTLSLGTGTDSAGNLVLAAPTSGSSFTVDNTAPNAPSAPIAAAGPLINSTEKAAGIAMIVPLGSSGAVTGDILELLLNGATFPAAVARTLTSADILGGAYAFTVSSSQIGADGVKPLTARITDSAGNVGTASAALSLTVDTVVPTAAITYSPASMVKAGVALTITVTFSESMASLPLPKLAVAYTGGITSLPAQDLVMGSDTVGTLSLTVPSGNGTATLTLSTGTDLAGNALTSAPTSGRNFTVDSTAPTVTITSTVSAAKPTTASTIPVTVTFSETVTGFDATDLTVANAAVSDFTGSGKTYTCTLTPNSLNTSAAGYNVTVDIPGGAATDTAGNLSTAATTFTRTYDTRAPTLSTVTIAPDYSTLPNTKAALGDTVTLTFTANESLGSTPVVTIGGTRVTATAASSPANTWTASRTITAQPTDGPIAFSITVVDAAGNSSNTAATTDGSMVVFEGDTSSPSVTLASTTSSSTNTNPIPVTVTFSEGVTGFSTADLEIANASVGNFTAVSLSQYTFDLTPTTEGAVSAFVKASAVLDFAGKTNRASSLFSRTYDNTAPVASVSLKSGQAMYTSSTTVHFIVSFSEPVNNFGVNGLLLIGDAAASTVTATAMTGSGIVAKTTYDIAVSGMQQDGSVTLGVLATAATDAVGLANAASDTLTVQFCRSTQVFTYEMDLLKDSAAFADIAFGADTDTHDAFNAADGDYQAPPGTGPDPSNPAVRIYTVLETGEELIRDYRAASLDITWCLAVELQAATTSSWEFAWNTASNLAPTTEATLTPATADWEAASGATVTDMLTDSALALSIPSGSSGTVTLRYLLRVRVASPGQECTFALEQGWNLVGMPADFDATEQAKLLNHASITAIWGLEGEVYYNVKSGGGPLLVKQGYWMYATSALTVTLTGTPVTSNSIALAEGWNLVAPVAPSVNPVGSVSSVVAVWEWDTALGAYVVPGADSPGDTAPCKPGMAYWVRASADDVGIW